jgi:tRNA A-37 threonylcarbamoyl transferase component Bud32
LVTPSSAEELQVGSVLGDYRVEALLARGGMGVVYTARQLAVDRRVALKVIAPALAEDESFRRRFERESRVAIEIEHPNIVPVYATGAAEGLLFIAMRYIDGRDLRRIIDAESPMSPERVLALLEQIASGLDAAHRKGLVHRDVKPANVMVERLGEDREHCYVLDFGLARQSESTALTHTGRWMGTPAYVAPEQLTGGDVDARTDVYALGALFFHALTGQLPYSRDHDAGMLFAHLNAPPPRATDLRSDLPHDLDAVLVRALAKDPAERFGSAGELASAAADAIAGTRAHVAEQGEAGAGARGRGTSAPARSWPLPAVLRTVPGISYVGRAAERAALEEAMALARGGARPMVLLSGEPGIGKTRLASYGAHRAHAEGMAVCWGSCSEELAVPYEPWIEVCSQIIEHAPHELLDRHVERHKGELGRLAGNLERRVPDLPEPQSSDPETERYLLFSAVTGLLGDVAQSVPVCVVLDDLHWADGQSVALLKHLVRTVEQGALQLIATYRDSDLGKDHPLSALLADLRTVEGVQRIALQGLDVDEVAQLMTAVAGHELEEDGLELAAQIAAETDGNPFFVGEILRALSETGALTFEEASGRWSIDRSSSIALPESVREVIERRVERLGEEALEALRFAAVIGREFDVELLSAVVEVDEGRLLDHLEAAVAASVLSESAEQVGRFRFVHALINQTLYEGLGRTRRARMHHRVGEALEELSGPDPAERLSELALHWRLAAVSVDIAKAAGYARRAGQRALESLAPDEAMKLFTDAVELTGDMRNADRCEALIGLGEAQRQSGDAAYRETLLEASRIAGALGDAELAASAALANNRGNQSVVGQLDAERMSAIEHALELDDPPQASRHARLLALQAIELAWDPDFTRRKALADEAVSLARVAGDPRTMAEVLHLAFFAYWSAETLELRGALIRELSRCASSLRDPALHFWVHSDECQVFIERGDFVRARAALEREQQIAEELGQPTLKWVSTSVRAGWALLHGDMAGGEPLIERAFQIGQEGGQPDAVFFYGALLAHIRTYQGRGQEIVAMLEQSVSAYPAIAAWKAALAQLLAWLGRGAESAAILEDAVSDRFEHVPPSPARSTALVLYAEAAVLTGNAGAAAILYELIEPWAEQVVWNGSTGYGHARMWLGLLAAVIRRHEQADQHLQFACEFHKANEMPLLEARGHLGWAQALAGRGEAGRAREHAARALELSRANGYGLFVEPAAALLGAESAAQA